MAFELRPREDEGVWGTVAGRRRGDLLAGGCRAARSWSWGRQKKRSEWKKGDQPAAQPLSRVFLNILQAPYLLAGWKFSQRQRYMLACRSFDPPC